MDVKTALLVIGWMLASAASNPKQSLVADLFRNYDRRVDPFGPNTTLDVDMTFVLVEISDVDEKKQVLTTNCWILLTWEDASLAWRPEKHGNVTEIKVPADGIWKPDLRVKNSVEGNPMSSSGLNNAILSSSGYVQLNYQVILKTSCPIDVKYFPMDQQECVILFESWTYNGDQLNITNGERGKASLVDYVPNAEWIMISYTKSRQVLLYPYFPPYITLKYKVILKRRPLFFMMYLMMPCLIITLVALLGLLVPNESGEKISIGITSLLAMIALLLVISTLLPPTSIDIPLIGWYYAVNIFIVSLSIGLAVLTLNIHHRGARGHKLPRLVKTLCFSILARILFIKIDLPESTDENMIPNHARDEAMHADKPAPTLTERQSGEGNNVVDNRLLHAVEKAMDLHYRRITTQDKLDEATYEWKLLAIVLERALTIIFLIVTICTAIAMFS